MIKQSITYDDYNDQSVTEEFYFNLTKLEIMELELKFEGGIENHIQSLIATTNGVEAYHLFKDIVLSSYGQKSADGKRFIKSPELTAEFEQSPALGELIFGFLEDGNDAAAFIRGLLPSKLVKEVEAEAKKSKDSDVVELPTAPPVVEEKKELTDEELLKMKPQDMTPEQLQRAYTLKTQQ